MQKSQQRAVSVKSVGIIQMIRTMNDCSDDTDDTEDEQIFVKRLDRKAKVIELSKDDPAEAILLVNQELSTTPEDEELLELKSACLLELEQYNKLLLLCKQAEGRFQSSKWPKKLLCTSFFALGMFQEADKYARYVPNVGVSSIPDLLKHKVEGDMLYTAREFNKCVAEYSTALANNEHYGYFAAECAFRRANAHSKLGYVSYTRRLDLFHRLRCYDLALADAITILKLNEKCKHNANVKATEKKIDCIRTEMKSRPKDNKPNYGLLMGLDSHCTEEEFKKIFRTVSLQFHPDKIMLHVNKHLATKFYEAIDKQTNLFFKIIAKAKQEFADIIEKRSVLKHESEEQQREKKEGRPSSKMQCRKNPWARPGFSRTG